MDNELDNAEAQSVIRKYVLIGITVIDANEIAGVQRVVDTKCRFLRLPPRV